MTRFDRPQTLLRARTAANHAAGGARAAGAGGAKKWYRIENPAGLAVAGDAAGAAAEIYIYEEIGYWGMTADQFVSDLRNVTAPTINLHLNSPGGDVFDGIAIHNALKAHPAQVNVHVDALAASIASVIAMAGDTVHMPPSSYLMIHNAWCLAIGDSAEMRKTADLLEKINGTIAQVYAARGTKTQDEFQALMTAETWLTAQEAVDAGLADVITQADAPDTAAAMAAFDLSFFAKVPDALKRASSKRAATAAANPATPKTKREFEDFLRDAGGYSRAAAKAIAAGGFKHDGSEPRDEDELASIVADVRARVSATQQTFNINNRG